MHPKTLIIHVKLKDRGLEALVAVKIVGEGVKMDFFSWTKMNLWMEDCLNGVKDG